MKSDTIEKHVCQLEKMMETVQNGMGVLEEMCPADQMEKFPMHTVETCNICLDFIEIYGFRRSCPCNILGTAAAMSITKQKIKEWGEQNGVTPKV